MPTELILNFGFGRNSGDANYLGPGWSGDEDGFRWMIGEQSELWLDSLGAGTYLLEFDLSPFVRPPAQPAQRLAVSVRGTIVGRSVLTGRRTLGFRIPAELLAGRGPVRFGFQHPDAARPVDLTDSSDDRRLALSARRLGLYRVFGDTSPWRSPGPAGVAAAEVGGLVGIPALQFMLGFESLGDDCEFGLMQRRCGAEPLCLLRFADIELGWLLHALAEEFDGLGRRENLELNLTDGARREYVLRDRGYALTFHTFQYEGEVDAADLLDKQISRLGLLRRKLLDDLRGGKKIFVCKRNEALHEQDVLPLHAALNRYAPNTLLFVTTADTADPAGTVERLMPGLLKGSIDRLAPPEDAHDLYLEQWLAICVNAHRLVRETSAACLHAAP